MIAIDRAYILAGGHSRRFGSDKARAAVGSSTLIEMLSVSLAEFAIQVIVVAQQTGAYNDLGLSTIADDDPDRGPVGGLATAIRHFREVTLGKPNTGWMLAVSCDCVGFELAWLDALRSAENTPGLAIVFRDSRWQPFPGLYHVDLFDSLSRELLESNPSMQHVLDLKGHYVHSVSLDGLPPLRQANTPDELARWKLSRY